MRQALQPKRNATCVLLFSGGRDSTIAALRLSEEFERLVLVTVTTDHLVALQNVKRRLAELRSYLPAQSQWIHAVIDSESIIELPISTIQLGFSHQMDTKLESCLPCHLSYFQTALIVASYQDARHLAVGYTSYQSDWLEQTPYAIARLREILDRSGKELLLPSQDLSSKEQAQALLREYGLTDASLEQKCLKQQFNDKEISPENARKEIDAWAVALERAFASPSLSGVKIFAPTRVLEVNSDDVT
jgi:hypothetical protein